MLVIDCERKFIDPFVMRSSVTKQRLEIFPFHLAMSQKFYNAIESPPCPVVSPKEIGKRKDNSL